VGVFSVTAYDAYGNVATGYTGTVSSSSSDDAAELPDDYTFTTADNGMHYFAAALNTPGIQWITATDTANPNVTGTQDGIEVDPPSTSTGGVGGLNAGVVPLPVPAAPSTQSSAAQTELFLTSLPNLESDPRSVAVFAGRSNGLAWSRSRQGSRSGTGAASARARDLAFADWRRSLSDAWGWKDLTEAWLDGGER
jgi:hypothetical protein